jgi:sugar O-acyltransferase (sialic acid O-acetyltransferase NeuD family)
MRKGGFILKKIAVFGAGGHAKVVTDLIQLHPELTIEAVFADSSDEQLLPLIAHQLDGGIVAIGDNHVRRQVTERILSIIPDFAFVTLIHPHAIVAHDVVIGIGTVVMAGAIINTGATIGSHSIINTRSSVDHDCFIGAYASIGPGATLGGGVDVGSGSAIGLGANLIQNVSVDEHSVIGAGSTVVKSIPAQVIAYGSPARVIRSRQIGEKYM